MENKYKVAICLVTYNQERFIRQAIDSVLMQQTLFDYTCFVGEDCSTDSTPAIIDEYANKYPNKVVHLCTFQNIGIVGNTYHVFQHIFADEVYKYVALLDGDDFWTDSLKLQKQVDFMESHPDYAFVFARMGMCDQLGGGYSPSKPRNIGTGGDWFLNLMRIGINNGTVMHRVEYLKKIDWKKIITWNLLSCDYTTNVFMAAQGKVGFIDEEMGVWRRGGGTTSSPKNEEKLLRYVDHECRQGLHLAAEFPNTPYADFTQAEAEKHRNYQIIAFALSTKCYETLRLVEWEKLKKYKPWWAKKRLSFWVYVYPLKKIKTLLKLCKRK